MYETEEGCLSLDGVHVATNVRSLHIIYLYKCSTDYLLGKSNDKPSVVLDTDGLTPEQIQALQTLIKTMKHE